LKYTKLILLVIYHGSIHNTRDLKISFRWPRCHSLFGFSLYLKVQCTLIPFLVWWIPHPLKKGKRDEENKQKIKRTSIWLKRTHTKTNQESREDKELHSILSCTCFHISIILGEKQKILMIRVLWWLNK